MRACRCNVAPCMCVPDTVYETRSDYDRGRADERELVARWHDEMAAWHLKRATFAVREADRELHRDMATTHQTSAATIRAAGNESLQ